MTKEDSLPLVILFSKDTAKFTFIQDVLKDLYILKHISDAEELMQWLAMSSVDILIVDYAFLKEKSFEITEQIKKAHKKNMPAMLLITNKLQKSFTIEALSAGISDFLREPLSAEEIVERIFASLKSRYVSKKIPFVTSNIQKGSKQAKDAHLLKNRAVMTEKSLEQIVKITLNKLPVGILFIEAKASFAKDDLLADEVEKITLQHIQQLLRPQDVLIPEGVGRYVVLLPKTSSRACQILAGDMKDILSKKTLCIAGKQLYLSISIGIECYTAQMQGEASSFDTLGKILEKVKKSLEKGPKKGNKNSSNTP